MAVHLDSYTEARAQLKHLLDAAQRGTAATLRRDGEQFAVVDADRLRYALVRLHPSEAVGVAEDGGWSAFLAGLPVAADGLDFDDTIDDLILALREYAEDWSDHLFSAPNHQDNWGVAQLVQLSSDDQLREWLLADN